MGVTYDVRIYKNDIYHGARGDVHIVRWKTGNRSPWKERFRNKAQAESFRSELVSAARKGEAFDLDSGRPVSHSAALSDIRWLEFARAYVAMKWPTSAATYRRSIAEALTHLTVALIEEKRDRPDAALIRHALYQWAFVANRAEGDAPVKVQGALRWLNRHSPAVSTLAEASVLRRVLAAISVRLDGTPAAGSVVSKRRRVLFNATEYAVELKYLTVNPLVGFKWAAAPKPSGLIDRRSVVNPVQARVLLDAVRNTRRSGPRLVAFFGLMYFSALRPEEAANVRDCNLSLSPAGWGEVHLERATPYAGSEWTNDGRQREERQLKNRAVGEGRTVPMPPELVALLRSHLAEFGTGAGGRLFPGERAEELPKLTYMRAWRAARAVAFVPEVAATPLAATPYALRHACVSTWLNGGVPAPQVAEWAGHSVEVLLRIYAKCLDGQDAEARRRVMRALGHQG